MTDFALFIFTSDKRVLFAKNAKDGAPKLVTIKHYQDPVARIKSLYGIDITMSEDEAVPVHKVLLKFATIAGEPPARDDLVAYESLEAFLESVPYEERGYPLRCKGWVGPAFASLKNN